MLCNDRVISEPEPDIMFFFVHNKLLSREHYETAKSDNSLLLHEYFSKIQFHSKNNNIHL